MERRKFLRSSLFHIVLLAVLIAADQLVKLWARTALKNAPLILWKDVFSLRLVYNTGGPWGVMGGHTVLLTLFSVIVLVIVIFAYLWLPKSARMRLLRFCIALITAGAVGNIIDRIMFGRVTDMFSFDLIQFPVFNVADSCIVCGCILACYLLIFYYKDEDFNKWKKSNS
ncbi:MAG: signal peptidase II [Lachnospiraceae bacterium]|nr:signal peptidase II [Lachnospiraceae bacterium]